MTEPSTEMGEYYRAPLRRSSAQFFRSEATELRHHRPKYAAEDLGTDKSFLFRGPQAILDLKARNMNLFVQMAQGVDEVGAIEKAKDLASAKSRSRIIEAIQQHYTTPALESTLQSVEIALSTMKRFSGEILTV